MTAKVFSICRQTARRITYDFSPGRVKEVDKNKRFLRPGVGFQVLERSPFNFSSEVLLWNVVLLFQSLSN
jgi:hypothetical protein